MPLWRLFLSVLWSCHVDLLLIMVFSFQIDVMLLLRYSGSIRCCVSVMTLWPVCPMLKVTLHLNQHLKGSLAMIKGLLTQICHWIHCNSHFSAFELFFDCHHYNSTPVECRQSIFLNGNCLNLSSCHEPNFMPQFNRFWRIWKHCFSWILFHNLQSWFKNWLVGSPTNCLRTFKE